MPKFATSITLPEQVAPGTPATGGLTIYAKADGGLYYKNDAGAEFGPLTGGTPANMVTTDTTQSITGSKNFVGGASFQTGGGNFTVRLIGQSNAQFLIDRAGTNWPGVLVDGGAAPLSGSTLAHWSVRGHSGNTTNDIYQGQNSAGTAIFRVKADGGVVTATNFTDSTGQLFSNIEPYIMAVTGNLSVQTGKSRIYLENNYVIESIRASVNTAPAGASVIVDVNLNGTSVYTTQANRPTITAGTNTSKTTPNTTSVATGQYLTVDVDAIGSTTAGADLTVVIRLRRI